MNVRAVKDVAAIDSIRVGYARPDVPARNMR